MKQIKRITDNIIFNQDLEKKIVLQTIDSLISKVPSGGNYQLTIGTVVEFLGDIKGCTITIDYFDDKE
ncbi:TPA: hypothetical protein LA460_000120 [Clostridium botulinum]|nr:hypothetical protein [Clostridium botulinum]HBJ1652725.1 hypothetical protein [Clostridium botulinum]